MGSVQPITDVLIIGGSHAGLAAALTLYRALHTHIIFDSSSPRDCYDTYVHLSPTWEDTPTSAYKAASRAELERAGYTQFIDLAVAKIEKTEDGLFQATDVEGGQWLGRKVLIANGERDIFPPVDGYKELYASRIFQCMFQFGYERRGTESAGLLALEGLANVFHSCMLAEDGLKYASKVTIYTSGNPTLASEIQAALQSPDISIDDRKVNSLAEGKGETEVIITFEDGSTKNEGFIIHRPDTELDTTFVDQLGLTISDRGDILTMPPFCQTSVPGVYAAGDCASPMKIIPNAISMGAYAGCGIARELPRRVTGNSIKGLA